MDWKRDDRGIGIGKGREGLRDAAGLQVEYHYFVRANQIDEGLELE